MRDVPEVILSMLHGLQRSPVHSTHEPRTLDTIIDSHRLIAEKSHALESESESGDSSEEEPWQSSSSELSLWSEEDAGTGEDELGDRATESPVASVAAIVTEVTFSVRGPLCSYLNGELYEECYARLYNKVLSSRCCAARKR